MNRFSFVSLIAVLAALLCVPAVAGPVGFNGAYNYSTWTSSETYGGSVVSGVDASHQTLTLMEPDSYPSTPYAPQEFDFSHVVANSGVVSFDWSFNADVDGCCSGLNFYVDGVLYNLTGGYFGNQRNWNGANTSGVFSVDVKAGDTITFGAFSADSCCGATTNTITDFEAPAVPEPASIALFGVGLVLLTSLRRRKAD